MAYNIPDTSYGIKNPYEDDLDPGNPATSYKDADELSRGELLFLVYQVLDVLWYDHDESMYRENKSLDISDLNEIKAIMKKAGLDYTE